MSIALGSAGGTQILAVAYRGTDSNAPAGCYFRRLNAESMSLGSRSATLTLSAAGAPCLNPSVVFNPASKRFVVTYAEQDSGVWLIKSREVTLGSTDTLSASQTIVTVGTSPPLKLQTTFYPGGNWLGVIYREHPGSGADTLRVHGYHLSPF